ncbi:hypothetical protein EX30DRAFT_341027 [Ascodesmis nigricans]|uniref:Uncharacterized protein n=1 Tax=Ascodesmis nigricans TaxID=341454 RepID=A0A4V3SIQ5_9PEZI|nr:hypothetical protein EX30DRAFT_341027 [Ascodesmis nigricans]
MLPNSVTSKETRPGCVSPCPPFANLTLPPVSTTSQPIHRIPFVQAPTLSQDSTSTASGSSAEFALGESSASPSWAASEDEALLSRPSTKHDSEAFIALRIELHPRGC